MGFWGRRKNNAIQSAAENYLIKNIRSGDVVVITLRLPYYFGRDGFSNFERDFVYNDTNGGVITRKEFFEIWKAAVVQLASTLQEKDGFDSLFCSRMENQSSFQVQITGMVPSP